MMSRTSPCAQHSASNVSCCSPLLSPALQTARFCTKTMWCNVESNSILFNEEYQPLLVDHSIVRQHHSTPNVDIASVCVQFFSLPPSIPFHWFRLSPFHVSGWANVVYVVVICFDYTHSWLGSLVMWTCALPYQHIDTNKKTRYAIWRAFRPCRTSLTYTVDSAAFQFMFACMCACLIRIDTF